MLYCYIDFYRTDGKHRLSVGYISINYAEHQEFPGSIYVLVKLSTYSSPNLTFCPKREVSVNVRFWDG